MTQHADPIDAASEQERMILDAAIAYRKPEGPSATGQCLHCEEPVALGVRWCDADCRDMWERELTRR